MIFVKVKGTKSWLDPRSQRSLAANLTERLWNRCQGHRGLFVTLTYRRDEYDGPLDLYRKQAEQQHVPLFLRKVKRRLGINLKGKWFCKMEFQNGGWVHWHLIILDVEKIPHAELLEMWGHGHVWVNRLNQKRVRYACKYIAKDGVIPQFLYGERPKAVKIVRVSPGFWGDTERKEPPEPDPLDEPPPKRFDFYRTIGSRIEECKETLIIHDEEGRYQTAKGDLGPVLAALLEDNCGIIGNDRGWIAIDADWPDIERAVDRASAASRRVSGGGGTALYLTEDQNPDAVDLPRWLKGILWELHDHDPWSDAVAA